MNPLAAQADSVERAGEVRVPATRGGLQVPEHGGKPVAALPATESE